MVIIKVSSSKEKAMLSTVRILRRLLRKAFLVTNRVRVMGKPQGDCSAPPGMEPVLPRINERVGHPQTRAAEFSRGYPAPFQIPQVNRIYSSTALVWLPVEIVIRPG